MGGGWYYPPIAEALWNAGFKKIEVYIGWYNTLAQFIATWTIIDLCL